MYAAKDIAFRDIAINEGNGWFYNIGYNAIFRIDLETGKLKLETFISGKNRNVQDLFIAIAYYDEKLYLAPWEDNRLCIYDLRKREFNFIDLDLARYGDEKNHHLFRQVEVIDNNVYFFSGSFHAIVKLNPADNSLEYIDSWYEDLSTRWDGDKQNMVIFHKVHVAHDGWCILPCWKADVILKVNVLSGEYAIVESGFNGEFFDAVETENEYIGAFKDGKSIYKISDKGFTEIPLEAGKEGDCFIFKHGSDICLIPRLGTKIGIYDVNTYEKKLSYEFPDPVSDSQKWISGKVVSLCNKKIDDHRIVSYSTRSGEILIIDMLNYSVRSIVPTMDDETEQSIKEHLPELFRKTLFVERANYRLEDFLGTLSALL